MATTQRPALVVVLATGVALLFAGLVLAVLVIPEFGPWVNGPTLFHVAFHHGRR